MKLQCVVCQSARKLEQVLSLGKNERLPSKALLEWKCPECGANIVIEIRTWEKGKPTKSASTTKTVKKA